MCDRGLDVAVVTPRYPPISTGGGQRSAELLATSLVDASGVDSVTVYAFDGTDQNVADGVTVHRLGAVSSTVTEYQNIVAARKLRGRFSNHDVVHGYNMELHPAIGYLSTVTGVASVATLNSYHFFRSSVTNTSATGLQRLYELVGYPTTGLVLRRLMSRIDAFVALSEAIERIYRERGFSDARIEQVPNMLDPEFSIPDRNDSTDGYSLLYVGTLTENKGVSYLIRALAELPPSYHLRIAGTGPESEELVDLADRLGISGRIGFEGWVDYDKIGELYASADLFVHPGIWPEPFNRTVLEAMQAGLPVVCTDVGGPPEAISHEQLVCDPADHESLAASIERARRMADDVGAVNRDHVEREHAPSVVVPQLVELYRELRADAEGD